MIRHASLSLLVLIGSCSVASLLLIGTEDIHYKTLTVIFCAVLPVRVLQCLQLLQDRAKFRIE